MAKKPRFPMAAEDKPQKSVASRTTGKFKTITETIALILLLSVLGAVAPTLLFIPLCVLMVAMVLGALSLFSQLLL